MPPYKASKPSKPKKKVKLKWPRVPTVRELLELRKKGRRASHAELLEDWIKTHGFNERQAVIIRKFSAPSPPPTQKRMRKGKSIKKKARPDNVELQLECKEQEPESGNSLDSLASNSFPFNGNPNPMVTDLCIRSQSYMLEVCRKFLQQYTNGPFSPPADVTLLCEGQSIRCHRLPLMFGSVSFENEFKGLSPSCMPAVVFVNVKYSILLKIIRFIYYAEVNIDASEFDDFKKMAELLKIKGLNLEESGQNPGYISMNSSFHSSPMLPFPQARTPALLSPLTNFGSRPNFVFVSEAPNEQDLS